MLLTSARGTASIFFEHPDHRKSFQQICAVGGMIKTGGQIYTSGMQHLMPTILPQETEGYVIYSALVGYKGRCSILAIVLAKFLFRKLSHLQEPRIAASRNMGEALIYAGLPSAESELTPGTCAQRGRFPLDA